MKKKTLTIIIALACAVALALGCIAAHAVTSDRSKASEQEQDVSERVDAVNEQEQDDSEKVDAVNDEVINTIRNRSYGDETSLYEYCCAHASDEQRRQLESFELGYTAFSSEIYREGYTRQIETIMGALSSDTPRLTVEQARAICAEVNDMGIEDWWEWRSELDRRLCAVTGAPDYEGGSGIGFTVYYLNGEHTRYLQVTIGFAAVFDAATHTVVEYITEPIA